MKERILDTDGDLLEAQYHKTPVEIRESVCGDGKPAVFRGTVEYFNRTSVKVRNGNGETAYFHREMCVVVESTAPLTPAPAPNEK